MSLLGTYLVIQFIKSNTWELFFSYVFFYGKVGSIILFMLAKPRAGVYYMIFCFLLWIILKNPRYSGSSKLIKIESKDHFFELVGKDVSPSTGTN